MAEIGLKAGKPHRFDFFGLTRRDAATQRFYDQFKKAFEAKASYLKQK